MKNNLPPRLRDILDLVVHDYIKTAEPVASDALVSRHKLPMSSATVRKVLADLEGRGLLTQAHTSAGRTPTEEGLKTYVDEILSIKSLSGDMRAIIDREMGEGQNGGLSVLSVCSKVLSNITRHMGVAIAPFLERLPLKQVYFVRLGFGEILAIMSGENGLMPNKVLSVPEDYTQDELNQVNSYLADIAKGLTLSELREKILKAMGDEKKAFDALYLRALNLSSSILALGDPKTHERSIYMEGQGNLLDSPEFAEAEAMKSLFKAFEDKRRIMDLLSEVADSGQVRIVIGQKALDLALGGLALVASP
ncbi:MAG: heat-inducible transcriptional repressor HrcA, partial [Candidatus Adiutrix sp.]